MNRRLAILIASLLGAALGAQDAALPSAKDILTKSIEATGGKAYRELKTVQLTGTIEAPQMGVKGKAQMFTKAPDKSLLSQELDGIGKMRQGTDGKVCWSEDPFMGARLMAGKEAAAFKLSDRLDLLTRWEEYFTKLEVVGVEKVGEFDCFAIKATPKDQDVEPLRFCIDNQAYLLRQLTMTAEGPQGKLTTVMSLADYRDVQGIKTPHQLIQKMGPMTLAMTIASVKYNEPIADDVFAPPANAKPAAEGAPAAAPPAPAPGQPAVVP